MAKPDDKGSDKRFEVSIPLVVEEVKDGQRVPFFETELKYHDLPYDGVVAIQAALVELLQRLNGFGLATAEALGLGDKLRALGLTGKHDK